MIKNLKLNKDEEGICSITCYPSLTTIVRDAKKNLLEKVLWGALGVTSETRFPSRVILTLTNKKLYLNCEQDNYNSNLNYNSESKAIPLNEIESFIVTIDKENEVIDISLKNDFISLLHPNTENKALASKMAHYIKGIK